MRRQIVQRGMQALSVVVCEVFADLDSGDSLIFVIGHFQFGLEPSKTRFHKSVVITIGGAAHALQHARTGQDVAILGASVLGVSVSILIAARSTIFGQLKRGTNPERLKKVDQDDTRHRSRIVRNPELTGFATSTFAQSSEIIEGRCKIEGFDQRGSKRDN